eukprot:jgi/Picre1/28277/NNA_003683.t1
MSDDDERNEDPMLGFMFGNVGEDSELEEEYELDKGVLRQLANFNKQKAVLKLQDDDIAEEDKAKQEQDAKEFEVNEFKAEKDAEDFMDEDELIEVAEVEQDGAGAEAEFEDYDVRVKKKFR